MTCQLDAALQPPASDPEIAIGTDMHPHILDILRTGVRKNQRADPAAIVVVRTGTQAHHRIVTVGLPVELVLQTGIDRTLAVNLPTAVDNGLHHPADIIAAQDIFIVLQVDVSEVSPDQMDVPTMRDTHYAAVFQYIRSAVRPDRPLLPRLALTVPVGELVEKTESPAPESDL